MSKTRLISLLAACLMLSGCAAQTAGGDAAPSATQTDAPKSSETTTAPPEYIAPGRTYDGAELCAAAFYKSYEPLKYCEVFTEGENGDVLNDALYQRNAKLEDTLKIKLTLYPVASRSSSPTEIINLILAGDEKVGMLLMNFNLMPKFLNAKLASELSTLETFTPDSSWWNQNSRAALSMAGKNFAISGDFTLYNQISPVCIVYSKSLAANNKVENLYDMVRNDKWLLTDMFSICKKVARDLDGDGAMTPGKDVYGIWGEGKTLQYMLRNSGIRLTENDASGKPALKLNTPSTQTLVEMVVPQLRDKNVNIFSIDVTGTGVNAVDLISGGKLLFYSNQLYNAMFMRESEEDFGLLPMPKYKEDGEYITVTNDSFSTFVMIPVTNSKLDMTGDALNLLGYYSQQLVTPALFDSTITVKGLRDEDSAEMMELILSTLSYDIASAYDFGGIKSVIEKLLTGSDTNFASAYAANEAKINAAIDTAFDIYK